MTPKQASYLTDLGVTPDPDWTTARASAEIDIAKDIAPGGRRYDRDDITAYERKNSIVVLAHTDEALARVSEPLDQHVRWAFYEVTLDEAIEALDTILG